MFGGFGDLKDGRNLDGNGYTLTLVGEYENSKEYVSNSLVKDRNKTPYANIGGKKVYLEKEGSGSNTKYYYYNYKIVANPLPLFDNIEKSSSVFNLKVNSSGTDVIKSNTEKTGVICGINKGTIRYVTVDALLESTAKCTGLICGQNDGILFGCFADGSVSSSKDDLGGICGFNNGIMERCSSSASVKDSGTLTRDFFGSEKQYLANNVGGFCGRSSGTIKDCLFDGTLDAKYDISDDTVISGTCGKLEYKDETSMFINCLYYSNSENYNCLGKLGKGKESYQQIVVKKVYRLQSDGSVAHLHENGWPGDRKDYTLWDLSNFWNIIGQNDKSFENGNKVKDLNQFEYSVNSETHENEVKERNEIVWEQGTGDKSDHPVLCLKRESAVCEKPAILDVTYDGTDRILIGEAEISRGNGVVMYRYKDETEWHEYNDLPKKSQAGDYIIEYYVAAGNGYEDSDVNSITAKIKQAPLDIKTSVDESYVFDTSFKPVVTSEPVETTVSDVTTTTPVSETTVSDVTTTVPGPVTTAPDTTTTPDSEPSEDPKDPVKPAVDINVIINADPDKLKSEVLEEDKIQLPENASIRLSLPEKMFFQGETQFEYTVRLKDFDARDEYFDYAGFGIELPEGFSVDPESLSTSLRGNVEFLAADSPEAMTISSKTGYNANGGYVAFRDVDTTGLSRDAELFTIKINVADTVNGYKHAIGVSSVYGRLTENTVVNENEIIPYIALIDNHTGDKKYALETSKVLMGLRGDADLNHVVDQIDATIILRETLSLDVREESILADNIRTEEAGDDAIRLSHFLGNVSESEENGFTQLDATYILRALLAADVDGDGFVTEKIWKETIRK